MSSAPISNGLNAIQSGATFVTLGGIETTLHYKTDFPLRQMAAFEALLNPKSSELLNSITQGFTDVAVKYKKPIILDTETWRASTNWFNKLETSPEDRQRIQRVAVQYAKNLAARIDEASSGTVPTVIQGVIGPRADGYIHDASISIDSAREYHREQIRLLKDAGADFVGAFTLTTSIEGIAIAMEANEAGIPCAISFTIDVDGLVPSGETLKQAVEAVDAVVDPKPAFFMINCVHPKYVRKVVEAALQNKETWVHRLKCVRGNASSKTHAELEQSTELDEGNAEDFAKEMLALQELLPSLTILGGCCGTGSKHCEEIAKLLK